MGVSNFSDRQKILAQVFLSMASNALYKLRQMRVFNQIDWDILMCILRRAEEKVKLDGENANVVALAAGNSPQSLS